MRVSSKMSVCLSVCPSVCLSVCPSVRLSVCPSVRLSVLSVCPSVRLSVCPSVRLSVCPSVRLSVCQEFVPNYLLYPWSDQAKFFYKNQRKCVFENFNPEVQGSTPQGLGPIVDSGAKSTLSYNFCPIVTKCKFLER